MKLIINKLAIFLFLLIGVTSCLDNEDPNEQLNKEISAIDKYLDASVTDYKAYSSLGIRFAIQQFGQLPPPRSGQTVKATVVGKLFPSFTVFKQETINIKLDDISVYGLRIGISTLMNGSTASIYIPSEYAFGKNGTSLVPGNTSVVYEVTITEVIRTAVEQSKFEADTIAIQNFIDENEIDGVITHPSGVFYKVAAVGSGESPKVYDAVNFTYTGKLLVSNTTFDNGTLNSSIFGLIDGLKVGMPLLKINGGKTTFYIPSGLGYGPSGSGTSIPANSNLIFEIELN